MKMKVMRENPNTLQAAITVATAEHNLRKRFDLRSGNQNSMNHADSYGHEPMEVEHLRNQLRCYTCNRRGHTAKNCRSGTPRVNAISSSTWTLGT